MPRHSQKSSPPDIAVRRTASFRRLCRWSMRSSSRQTLGGKRLKCRTTAWIAGLLVEDGASRLLPGNDEQKESKERKKKSEAKRRQTQRSFAVPDEHGRASSVRRTSIGVPPRLLLRRPNATAQLQSALPGMGPVSGRYPQTDPSQYSEAPRRPVVVLVGRVPEAARERVASPPAGTALAPQSGMPPEPRPIHLSEN